VARVYRHEHASITITYASAHMKMPALEYVESAVPVRNTVANPAVVPSFHRLASGGPAYIGSSVAFLKRSPDVTNLPYSDVHRRVTRRREGALEAPTGSPTGTGAYWYVPGGGRSNQAAERVRRWRPSNELMPPK
jgi:hypothetical protein